ncbi:MAG: dihydroorotate dehydrogenase electron transfer subunit [Candidatus Gracilibacteria bacterium]
MSTTLPTTLAIQKIIPEAAGIKTFVFKSDLEFAAGKFVMVWIPRLDEKPLGIWRKKAGEFCLTVSAIGKFSTAMHQLKVGDKVGIRGAFGRGFTLPVGKKKIALIGGGFGVAPLLSILSQASGCKADVIIGARSKNLVFGNKHAEALGGKVFVATNDGSLGEKCFNTELFERMLLKKKYDFVYSCGPELMMQRVAEICKQKKIPCEISMERYMKCGIGVCGSCAVDDSGFCVCSHGPTIEGNLALKMVEFGKYHRDSVGERKNF